MPKMKRVAAFAAGLLFTASPAIAESSKGKLCNRTAEWKTLKAGYEGLVERFWDNLGEGSEMDIIMDMDSVVGNLLLNRKEPLDVNTALGVAEGFKYYFIAVPTLSKCNFKESVDYIRKERVALEEMLAKFDGFIRSFSKRENKADEWYQHIDFMDHMMKILSHLSWDSLLIEKFEGKFREDERAELEKFLSTVSKMNKRFNDERVKKEVEAFFERIGEPYSTDDVWYHVRDYTERIQKALKERM